MNFKYDQQQEYDDKNFQQYDQDDIQEQKINIKEPKQNDNQNEDIIKDDNSQSILPLEDEQYDEISQPLIDKLNQLDQVALQQDTDVEKNLNIRKNQMAIVKILVFVHNKSYFLLVNAETLLGEAYLKYECYDLAIQHLTLACKRNQKLYENDKERILFQAHIYMQLGICHMKLQQFQEALEYFEQAKQLQDDNNLHNYESLKLIAQCQMEMKNFETAIDQYNVALEKYEEKKEEFEEAESYKLLMEKQAFTMIEQAKAYALNKQNFDAIATQERAIEKLIDIQYDIEKVADQYRQLSIYQKDQDLKEQYINSLNNIVELYKSIHGPCDKKVIKTTREISIQYLKQGNQEAALKQLYETEKLEEIVYGKFSLQVGKTYKIIASVLILLTHYQDAKRYFTLAMECYEQNNQKQQVQEIKEKLQFVRDLEYKNMYNVKEDEINNNNISEDFNQTGQNEQQQQLQQSNNNQENMNIQDKLYKQKIIEQEKENVNESIESKQAVQKVTEQELINKKQKFLDYMFQQEITSIPLLECQKILNKQNQIEDLFNEAYNQFKQIFNIKELKIYAINDDEQPNQQHLYTINSKNENIIIPIHPGFCGSVLKSGCFEFSYNLYSDPRFNSIIDMETSLPIICFTFYNSQKVKKGVIQCLDPKGLSNIINQNDQYQDKPSDLLVKLFQFGLILGDQLSTFQSQN